MVTVSSAFFTAVTVLALGMVLLSNVTRRVERFIEVTSQADTADEVRQAEKVADVVKEPIPKVSSTRFVLSDLILREWGSYGFVSVITYGRQGVGKSIYNMKVATEVWGYLKRSISWKNFIDRYVVFDIDSLVARIRDAGSRIPALVWDDAGVHGSSYWWFIDRKRTLLLSALFQTARTKLNALLMNSPNPTFILKHFRSVDSILVLVVKVGKGRSAAFGYQIKVLPSGTQRISKLFIDTFKRSMPHYEYYMRKRALYVDYVLSEISRSINAQGVGRVGKTERIAELVRQGYSVRQICRLLHVSPNTVVKVRKQVLSGGWDGGR